MKSRVTKPYDYHLAEIPQELCLWRIPEEELEQQIETLSRNHAFEEDADTVMMGDSVACRSESKAARWNRPVMLFYPGRNICDADLENACVGAKLGEQRTVAIESDEVQLTVTRIVRRSNMPIGDELIAAENIPGVTTLEAYKRWYRETNEPDRRRNAAYRTAYYLTEQVAEKSEFEIDTEEKNTWVWEWVNRMYDALVEAGMDPTIPKEGFDFLTEEEAKADMFAQQEPSFRFYLANLYLAETLTGRNGEDICKERLKKVAEENNTTEEAIMNTSGFAMVYGRMVSDAALDELSKYTVRFLEV